MVACLDPSQKAVIGRWIDLLERRGPSLGFPHSSELRGSTIGGLRELRIQQAGRPYRAFMRLILVGWQYSRQVVTRGATVVGIDGRFDWPSYDLRDTWRRSEKTVANVSWRQVKDEMDPDLRREIEDGADALDALITLQELAKERDLTQGELAERLAVAQGNISRTLRRGDLRLSTLRELIEAMGGELELVARFPDAAYAIAPGERE